MSTQDKELETLKNTIGFKTAFKATLGFYFGKFVAALIGIAFFGLAFGFIVLVFKALQ